MLPVNRHRSGTNPNPTLAIGSGAALLALLFAAASCAPAADTGAGGDATGGSAPSGSGGKPSTGSGGKPSTGSGGSGTTGSGGSTPAGSGGTTAGNTGGSNSGSGGAAGSTDSGGAGGGGSPEPDASGAGGSGPVGPVGSLPTCTTEPAAMPPALKHTLVAKLPAGDDAGQIIGVPGEKGIYVIGHRSGKVFYAVDGKLDPTPLAAPAIKNNQQDEQGLLGITLHPKFAENKLFYLLYTAPNANIRIDEFERTGMTSSKMVRTIWDKPRQGTGEFHNGGQIWFNPKDGVKPVLYHSVGNNANKGQSGMPEGIAGRVHMHDVGGATVMSSTFMYGLRNPYRMTFDRLTGDMYIGEIDDPAGGAIFFSKYDAPKKNWGYSGASNGIQPGITGKEGDAATIGGVVYRGTKIPGICGRYFFASWKKGAIKSIVVKDGALVGASTANHAGLGIANIASFGEDGEGEMYYGAQGGEVDKIEAM